MKDQKLMTAAESAQAMGPASLPEMILRIPCLYSQEMAADECRDTYAFGYRKALEAASELAALLGKPGAPFALDERVRFILGRPNFITGPVAHRLRALGHDINTKCEDEQAYVLHWLLHLYFADPVGWRAEVTRVLNAEQNKDSATGG